MISAVNKLASVAEGCGGFKPALAAVDLLRLSDWGLMLIGGVLVLSFLAAGITRREQAASEFAPQRSCRLAPELLFAPIMAYLLAVVVLHHAVAWWFGQPQIPSSAETDHAAQSPDTVGVLANNLAYIIGAIACYLVGRRFIGTAARPFVIGDRRYGRQLLDGLVGVLMALALCQSTLYLTMRLIRTLSPQFSFPEHDVIDLLRDPACPEWLPAALWIGVAIATPVAEELFFRGLLQTVFTRVMRSRRLAVVSAGVLFGLAHSSQPQVIPALALFGVILGLLYERRGSLIGPIVAHALFNAKTLLWTSLGGT